MGEVELYKMKISRIGELEKIASSAFVVFLVGALFQARVNPNNLGDTLGFLLILCVLSVISIHFFVLNASYFVDIVELEEKLNVEHMGKIFFHWGSHLSITLSFLYLSVPLIFIASVWYTLLSQADVIRLSIAFVSTLIYCVVLVILVRKPLEAYRTMLKSRNERKITITSIEEVKSSQSNEGTVA